MSGILIESDSCCDGDEIATRAAAAICGRVLGAELFEEAGERYGLAASTIRKAFFQGPTLLSLAEGTRRRCIAGFRAVLAGHLLEDKVVYHGPAGQLLIGGIAHLVRARITGRLDERVAELARRDSVTEARARKTLLAEEEQRQWWSRAFFKVERSELERYDLILNCHALGLEAAVEALAGAAGSRRYRPTSYSAQALADLELEARAIAVLLSIQPEVRVRAQRGELQVQAVIPSRLARRQTDRIRQQVSSLAGVTKLEVKVLEEIGLQGSPSR